MVEEISTRWLEMEGLEVEEETSVCLFLLEEEASGPKQGFHRSKLCRLLRGHVSRLP